MGRLPSGWCGFQGSPWPTWTTVASLRVPASVQKSSDAFLVERFMYRIQSGLVGGEAVVPHMGGALLVDDFQQPVDLLFQAVDIHPQDVTVAGDGLAQGTLDQFGFSAHGGVSWCGGRRRVASRHRAGLFVYRGTEGGLEEGSLGEVLLYLAGQEHLSARRVVAQQLFGLPANRLGEGNVLRKLLHKLPSVNHGACTL